MNFPSLGVVIRFFCENMRFHSSWYPVLMILVPSFIFKRFFKNFWCLMLFIRSKKNGKK